jgi:hypothetical protein
MKYTYFGNGMTNSITFIIIRHNQEKYIVWRKGFRGTVHSSKRIGGYIPRFFGQETSIYCNRNACSHKIQFFGTNMTKNSFHGNFFYIYSSPDSTIYSDKMKNFSAMLLQMESKKH